jgi:hypothetical protein
MESDRNNLSILVKLGALYRLQRKSSYIRKKEMEKWFNLHC